MATANTTTLDTYLSLLKSHDWNYSYSSDHRAYMKGEAESQRIISLSGTSAAHKALYKQACKIVNNFGNIKTLTVPSIKARMFQRAHEMTHEIMQEGDDYRATFSLCLKSLHTAVKYSTVKKMVRDGAEFTAEFVKRSTGAIRIMRCKLGVTEHLKDGKCSYNARQYNLLTVFDVEKNGYRSIPIDALKRIETQNQTVCYA